MSARRGLSHRTRHRGTNICWLQDIVRGGVVVATVATSVNDADILTKWVPHDVMEAALGRMGFIRQARSQ